MKATMKKTTIQLIEDEVAKASNFPDPVIEYNFDKLPKNVTKTLFFGVPAKFNANKKEGTCGIVYKLT